MPFCSVLLIMLDRSKLDALARHTSIACLWADEVATMHSISMCPRVLFCLSYRGRGAQETEQLLNLRIYSLCEIKASMFSLANI